MRRRRLLSAVLRAREAGYRHIESYSPFPIHGMEEALAFDDPRLPWAAFLGGVAEAESIGFLGMYYTNVVDYPWNVGGTPAFVVAAVPADYLRVYDSVRGPFGVLLSSSP